MLILTRRKVGKAFYAVVHMLKAEIHNSRKPPKIFLSTDLADVDSSRLIDCRDLL